MTTMRFTILQENLKRALDIVGCAIASKNTIPTLENVYITAEGSKVSASGTDLEIGIRTSITAAIEEGGTACLPYKTLSEITKEMPNDTVSLEMHPETLTARLGCGKHSISIKGADPDDYPPFVDANNVDDIATMPADVLRTIIGQTAYAAATDESRAVLTGVLCRMGETMIDWAAADGFRLAWVEQPIETTTAYGDIIIPARTLNEVQRIIREGDVTIRAGRQSNKIIFVNGETTVMSRVIDGNFPDFRRIIPDSYEVHAIVDRAELVKAVRVAEIFARDSQNIIKFEVKSTGMLPSVVLSANTAERGASTTEVAGTIAGANITAAANCKYTVQALQSLPTQQVVIELQNKASPIVLKPVGIEGLTAIVMPMTLR